ncbi:unnamed protein product, partial [Cyprideis torosa]
LQVTLEEEFLGLSASQIIDLITSEAVTTMCTEEVVFEGVSRWVGKELVNERRKEMRAILEAWRSETVDLGNNDLAVMSTIDQPKRMRRVPGRSEYLAKIYKDLRLHKQLKEEPCDLSVTAASSHPASIYVIGGHDGASMDLCEVWNIGDSGRFRPEDNLVWCEIPSLPLARSGHSAALVDGVLYAIGGRMSLDPKAVNQIELSQVDRWLPGRPRWEECAPMAFPRRRMGVAVHSGYIYVTGGANTDQVAFDAVER